MFKHNACLYLLLALMSLWACQKAEMMDPDPDPEHPQDMTTLLKDLEGRYVGLIRNWIVNGHDIPGDTIWTSVTTDTFTLRIGVDNKGVWAFQAVINNSAYNYNQPMDDPSANLVSMGYRFSVDPVYGYTDGTGGVLQVWRSPKKAAGRFHGNPGPGRYGVYYEGVKIN